MRKLVVALLVGAMMSVSVSASFQENLKNENVNFANDQSVPVWLFEECIAEPNGSMTLKGEDYSLTFQGSDLDVGNKVTSYLFEYKTKISDFGWYNHIVGTDRAKMQINFNEGLPLPGKVKLTVESSPFAPYSTVVAYRFDDDTHAQMLAENIPVGENGSFSFTTKQGGEFLITATDFTRKQDLYWGEDLPTAEEILQGAKLDTNTELLSKLSEEPTKLPEPVKQQEAQGKQNPSTGVVV